MQLPGQGVFPYLHQECLSLRAVYGFPAGSPEVWHTRLKSWAFSLRFPLQAEFGLGFPREEGHQDQHSFDCDNIGFPCRNRHGDYGVRVGLGQV